MLGRLKSLFTSTGNNRVELPFSAELAPEQAFYAVGDVHGCLVAVEQVFAQIDAHRVANGLNTAPIVLLGDFVDRGEDSASVLERFKALNEAAPDRVYCLMGNHEKMMLDFLDDPAECGGRWLRFGGVQTLASYGIKGVDENSDAVDLMEACDALENALPPGMEAWIRQLPMKWQSGNVYCVHAAMDPNRTVTHQSSRVLLWGHPDFFKTQRDDGVWIVHGHTIVDVARASGGRISIDTGAYKTGRLSVAVVTKGNCDFL